MTLTTFDFDGTDGATLTAANTGADFWTGTGTWSATFSSPGAHGTTCAKLDVAKDAASWGLGQFAFAAGNAQAALRVYFKLAASSTSNPSLISLRNSNGWILQLIQYSGLQVFWTDSGNAHTAWDSNLTLAIDTWYRAEIVLAVGTTTSNGSIAANIYEGDGTTPLNAAGTMTASNLNLGTDPVTSVRLGTATTGQNGGIYYYDALALNDGATTEIGPVTQPTPQGGTKAWSGTTWAPVKGWSGTAWVPVKAWNGTTWV